ncbi:BID domain-containing T4SS effector [Bartonella sp. B23]
MKKYNLRHFERSASAKLNAESCRSCDQDRLTQHPEEIVYADVPSSHKKLPLTKRQIFKKIQKNSTVQTCMDDIRYHCNLVYGNPGILNKQLAEIIENPKQGKDLSLNIAGNPTSISELAGREVFGIKSHARKRAQQNVHSLCDSVERFMGVVYALRNEIVRTQTQQKNFDDLGSLEKAVTQDTRHIEEKSHSVVRKKSSHKIENEASTSCVKESRFLFGI